MPAGGSGVTNPSSRTSSDLPRRLFGDGFQKVRYVKMIAGDSGMAIEPFEFVNAVPPSDKAYHVRNGYIHMCVAVDKPEALAEAIVKAGGKEIWRSAPDKEPKAFFCSDPWGNVIEIFSTPKGAERSGRLFLFTLFLQRHLLPDTLLTFSCMV